MIEFALEFQYAEAAAPTLKKNAGSIPAGRCIGLSGGRSDHLSIHRVSRYGQKQDASSCI